MVMWTEGTDHGLVWDHGLAVIGGDVGLEAAVRLWDDLAGGGDLTQFLTVLSVETGAQLLALPPFAIALRSADGGWQLGARGGLEARVDDVVVRGAGVSTWAERVVESGSRVAVGGTANASASVRPIVAGVVPAASVMLGDAEAPAAASIAPLLMAEPSAERVPEAGPDLARAAEPGPPDADEPAAAPANPEQAPAPVAPVASAEQLTLAPAEGDASPDDEADLPVADDEPEADDDPPAEAPAVPADQPAPPASAFAPPGRFARQHGETQLFSVQDAAVQTGEGFVSGVPSSAKQPPQAPPAPDDDEGDHDGHTMLAAGLAEAVVTRVPDQPILGGPSVLAAVCRDGHANPPQRSSCFRCGAALDGEPRRVPRPSLGRVLLPNGERLELVAPIILGRNPRADRVQGSVLPRLVPLSQGHVSSNHLELRLEEWNVLAVDLHSTNGTYLRRHGEAPVRLGERPELLIAGDVLDLGHGVQLRLEELR